MVPDGSAACVPAPDHYNVRRHDQMKPSTKLPREILVTGGAGFIGSTLSLRLQELHPKARITVVDDFRSGDFRNLRGFKGDVVASDCGLWGTARKFDLIFHLASITDTTVRDQDRMVRDNVEGFRSMLDLARASKARVVYASSAATYGIANERMREDSPPAPANVYAFSKVILDNLAADARRSGLKVDGVRYFNVFGPREAHKGAFASMIWQLALQMRAGRRPRVFKHGEQKRDFVHVDDAVAATILASERGRGAVYNVGSGMARSFNDVIAALNATLGTKLDPDYFDNPYDFYQTFTEADLTRSRKELDYSPRFALESGIRDYMTRMGWARS